MSATSDGPDPSAVEARKCASCGGKVNPSQRVCFACEEREGDALTRSLLADVTRDLARRYTLFAVFLAVVGVVVPVLLLRGSDAGASEFLIVMSPFVGLAAWEAGWAFALTRTERHRKLCAFLPYPFLGVFVAIVKFFVSSRRTRRDWVRDAAGLPQMWSTSGITEADFFTGAALSLDLLYRLDDKEQRASRGRGA